MLIFDFDGTLADTQAGIVNCMTATLNRLGLPPVEPSELKSLIGLQLGEAFRRAAALTTDAQIAQAVATYREIYFAGGEGSVTLFSGVATTLAEIKRRGIVTAIATSRGKESLLHLLEQLKIKQYFDIFKADEDAVNKKPAPDLALAALSEAGCEPSEAMVIGDTSYDIMMGKAAGCRTCGVTYGNMSRNMLSEAAPDIVIDAVSELLHYL